jgi:transcriptional regulator with XRE-family HTH domain
MHTGQLLASHRKSMRVSQLELAARAGVSSRHLSFIETGRSHPGAPVLERLADELKLTCRDTNQLLVSAGYSPAFTETDLSSDAMTPVREALHVMLSNHDPLPAVVLDAHWNMLMANNAQLALVAQLLKGRDPLPTTANVMELLFHPQGYRPHIQNWEEVACFLLHRLQREQITKPDAALASLIATVTSFEGVSVLAEKIPRMLAAAPMITLRLQVGAQTLSLFSTLASFGTAQDAVMEELRIEHYFPADDTTKAFFTNANSER